MKVGIVVPYSWSFWGAVVEHAELQAAALQRLGVETRTIMGNDPPGSFTRVLHPRLGRHGEPPPDVIPVGRSVIVPANGSLPNIVLSPTSVPAIRRVLAREQFDVLHLHEPMTPAICIATLALGRVPMVATFHAHGSLGWMKIGKPVWDSSPTVSTHGSPCHRMRAKRRSRGCPATTRSCRTASSFPTTPTREGVSTACCSPAGRNRGKGSTSCSARGPRSDAAPALAFGSRARIHSPSGCC